MERDLQSMKVVLTEGDVPHSKDGDASTGNALLDFQTRDQYRSRSAAVPASFDCAMRKAAYEYGLKLLPRLKPFTALLDALDLRSDECRYPLNDDIRPEEEVQRRSMSAETLEYPGIEKDVSDAIFVAPDGDDGAVGTKEFPMRSVKAAADVAAQRGKPSVILRGGTHFLTSPIMLDATHSGLTFRSHVGESAVISGGAELSLEWAAHDVSGGKNVWVADVDEVDEVPGLQIDGKRLTRARYPNLPGGIEVSPGYGAMLGSGSAVWTPPQFARFGEPTYYTDTNASTSRPNNGWFEHYMIGMEGLCSVYDPPVSYWCSEHPSGGGAFAFRTPSGVSPRKGVLPHSPYAHPTDAIFFVWRPNRWANWMFEVSSYNASSNNYTFGRGGNQGARGENRGGDFFVENVFEELDSPGEFFFDPRTSKLYVWHNGTGAPPASASVVAPQLRTLLNVSASKWRPARDISMQGLAFKASRYTYMDAHGVPSAGDWALVRNGAVFLQGTENVTIDGCSFERLDGTGVMVSGYNRHTSILNSDFAYIGANAIAAWGYTNETDADPGRPGVRLSNAPAAGVDGTDGEHPLFTRVLNCSAREVGLYEKQSSFFVQAKTARSLVSHNVFFNGPRAGINANDGFGGGDEVSYNLVFSTCRESGDHGPFNSWDRQPFLTSVRDGTPSMTMAYRHIHHNFFIDNYSPQEDVDNDDGSAYYKTHHNFLVYGGRGMKNDYGGHDNHHYANVYAYIALGLSVNSQSDGHENMFYLNKVVMTGESVGSFACTPPGKTVVFGNAYFTPSGNVSECKMPLRQWQAQGEDVGSSVAPIPSDNTIIGWAKEMLGF